MSRHVALALLLVIPLLAGAVPATAQETPTPTPVANTTATASATATATPTPASGGVERPGPFDLATLRTAGTTPAGEAVPPSMRYLGDPIMGAVAMRHKPVSPIDNDWTWVEPGTTVQTDRLQLVSSAFGNAAGEYDLVVVYWHEEQRQAANGTTVPVAADQTVQRISVTLDDGRAATVVDLQSHYDRAWRTTAWLEQDGEPVPGARWTFTHQSSPASEQVQISSESDLWWATIKTTWLPGAAGIIAGLSLARLTLRRTSRGPGYGLGVWVFLAGFGGLVAAAGLWYEITVLIARVDIIIGLSLGVLAYGGGLRFHPPVERVAFVQKHLRRVDGGTEGQPVATDGGHRGPGFDMSDLEAPETVADGDRPRLGEQGYYEELRESRTVVPTIVGEDGRGVPKQGLRPFFARLFADPARLDLSGLQTRTQVSGDIDEKVYVRPDAEAPVDHTPARLVGRIPVWHRLYEETADGRRVIPEAVGTGERIVFGAGAALVCALPLLGAWAGGAWFSTPILGAIAGALVLVVELYGAADGEISYEPAPRHFVDAISTLTLLQRSYADAKTIDELEREVESERMRSHGEVRESEWRRDDTKIKEMIDMELSGDSDDSHTNGQRPVGGPVENGDGDGGGDGR